MTEVDCQMCNGRGAIHESFCSVGGITSGPCHVCRKGDVCTKCKGTGKYSPMFVSVRLKSGELYSSEELDIPILELRKTLIDVSMKISDNFRFPTKDGNEIFIPSDEISYILLMNPTPDPDETDN